MRRRYSSREARVDALGFSFLRAKSRSVARSCGNVDVLSTAFVTRVGLFVNEHGVIQSIFERTRLNLVQYHGDESPEFCDAVGLPFIKALRVRLGIDIQTEIDRYPKASGFLLMHT